MIKSNKCSSLYMDVKYYFLCCMNLRAESHYSRDSLFLKLSLECLLGLEWCGKGVEKNFCLVFRLLAMVKER